MQKRGDGSFFSGPDASSVSAEFTFDYGMFTNLAEDHIGENEHKDMDDYIHCKSLLFQQCRQGIVNGDDDYVDRIFKDHTCASRNIWHEDSRNDVYAENVELIQEPGYLGVAYDLKGRAGVPGGGGYSGRLSPFIIRLAAISLCRHMGIVKEDVLEALNSIQVKGRLEIV